jgi:serine/threonine-protein kinase
VEGTLGAGAFGTVYLAKDDVLGRRLAIKTVRLDALAVTGAPLEELTQRFQREARVSAQLKHPNIVTIYDVGESEGLSYLAMEYLEGQGLESLIASEGRLPPERAAAIGAQVAEALAYAHSQGVVHRDVKPANIMIESGDRVKVTDFGIAKAQTAENLTATGSLVGTPAYMSPEQARGGELDGRSDLFSLGCVLYEMLGGARAFSADSITGLIFKVITEAPRPLEELAPDAPAELLAVVRRSLSKAPEMRFPDGHAMAEALLQAAAAPIRRPARPSGDDDPTLLNRGRGAVATRPPRGASPTARTLPGRGATAARRPAAAEPAPRNEGGSLMPWLLLAAAVGVIGYAATRGDDTPESAPAPTETAATGAPAAQPARPAGTSPMPAPRPATTPLPAMPAPAAERAAVDPAAAPEPPPATTQAPPAPVARSTPWPEPSGAPPPRGHRPPGGGPPGGPGASQSPESRRAEQPAIDALSRLAEAQARYFQANGRYGSLVQLQRNGLMPRSTDPGMRSLEASYQLEIVAGRSTWRGVARPRSDPRLRTFEVDQTGPVRAR